VFGTFLAAAASAGCAASLATLQPAHVAPRGHGQVTAGFEVGLPTGTLGRVIDSAEPLVNRARERALTDEEVQQLLDVGVNVAASPPSFGQHFAAAYVPIDRTEVQLRYAGGGWRLGARYQPLRHEDGPFDMVVGFGAARATAGIPYDDVVPYLDARDFTRWTFDLPVLIGTSRSWFRAWVGPKMLYSRFDTRLAITLPNNPPEVASLAGHAWYFGGQGGFAIGYRYVFLGVELTMARLSGDATATGLTEAPSHRTDISGMVYYPALALMGEF
jgi:hypothetical protein